MPRSVCTKPYERSVSASLLRQAGVELVPAHTAIHHQCVVTLCNAVTLVESYRGHSECVRAHSKMVVGEHGDEDLRSDRKLGSTFSRVGGARHESINSHTEGVRHLN